MTEELLLLLKGLLERPLKPSNLYVMLEKSMGTLLRYKILLPAVPPSDRDTVKRSFEYKIGTEPVVSLPIPKEQPEMILDVPKEGEPFIELGLINIDAKDNRSTPSTFRFQALDTIPPPAPGQMTVQLLEEISDGSSETEEGGDPDLEEPPVEEPSPEEPPVEEPSPEEPPVEPSPDE